MNIFFNRNLNTQNTKGQAETTNNVTGKLSNLPDYIAKLQQGSEFRGEIIDIRNNAVKILLGSNDIINAQARSASSMNIGDILSFRVEENTGNQLLVKALSSGTTTGINMLMSALESAGCPVNERNLALVRELIDNGQAIDKNTIKTLIGNLNVIEELTVDSAVEMFKHDIPITKENVSQFNSYLDNNSKLINNFENLSADIANVFDEVLNVGEKQEFMTFAKEILTIIEGDVPKDSKNAGAEQTVALNEQVILEGKKQENVNSDSTQTLSQNVPEDNIQEGNIVKDTNTPENQQKVVISENEPLMDVKEPSKPVNEKNLITDVKSLLDFMDKLSPEELKEFISSTEFKEDIGRIIEDKFILKDDILKMEDKDIQKAVTDYYKEVEDKVTKLLNALENNGMDKSSLHNNANEIKNNLNFMNDMSNMAMFIQIPIKVAGNETHGELYVLNRKKNKNKGDDVLTAFLHLDMEHLGATDVNIRLENDKLTTKFTLSDAISQDIVEKHLHELKTRLDEKGYTTELLIEDVDYDDNQKEELSPFEQVLSLDKPDNYIKRYTLDVRA